MKVFDADHKPSTLGLLSDVIDAWIDVVIYVFQADDFLVAELLQLRVVLNLIARTGDIVQIIIVVAAKLIVALYIKVESVGVIEITSQGIIIIQQDIETIQIGRAHV